MDNVKDDLYYIHKIIGDLEIIIANTKGVTQSGLETNTILCDSVLFRIIQISENGAKLTDSFRLQHPDIPWRAIRSMRNRIVHDYGEVDLEVVYDTISHDIPDLLKKLINMK